VLGSLRPAREKKKSGLREKSGPAWSKTQLHPLISEALGLQNRLEKRGGKIFEQKITHRTSVSPKKKTTISIKKIKGKKTGGGKWFK